MERRTSVGFIQNQWFTTTEAVNSFFSVQNWVEIAFVIFFIVIAFQILHFCTKIALKFAENPETPFDDAFILKARLPVRNYLLLYGLKVLLYVTVFPKEPHNVEGFFLSILNVSLVVNTVWLIWGVVDIAIQSLFEGAKKSNRGIDDHLLPIFNHSIKIILGIVGTIYIIQALGYSVSGLITGLGIGGVAVALASQDTLSNFFGSIMIFADRPFKIGDWVTIDDNDGTIEHVGFRSTRIRTFAKTLITVPNSIVAKSSINNHTRMPKRRISMNIGLTYDTTVVQMEELVAAIREYLKSCKEIDQEFCMVNFTDFGAYSLGIHIYCFTVTTDWKEHLGVHQKINLAIMKLVEERNLSFAFPTQTVHFEGGDLSSLMGERNVSTY